MVGGGAIGRRGVRRDAAATAGAGAAEATDGTGGASTAAGTGVALVLALAAADDSAPEIKGKPLISAPARGQAERSRNGQRNEYGLHGARGVSINKKSLCIVFMLRARHHTSQRVQSLSAA
jgi:hypothetical protein